MEKSETIAVTAETKETFEEIKILLEEKRQEKQNAKDNFNRQIEALDLDIATIDKQLAALGESIG